MFKIEGVRIYFEKIFTNEKARSFKLPLSFAYFSHLVRGLGTGTGFSLGSI